LSLKVVNQTKKQIKIFIGAIIFHRVAIAQYANMSVAQ